MSNVLGVSQAINAHEKGRLDIFTIRGFLPIGYFPGGEMFGGADGKCYRHNVIWYQKMFKRGLEKTMTRDYEDLLEGGLGARVARYIQQIWDEALSSQGKEE